MAPIKIGETVATVLTVSVLGGHYVWTKEQDRRERERREKERLKEAANRFADGGKG